MLYHDLGLPLHRKTVLSTSIRVGPGEKIETVSQVLKAGFRRIRWAGPREARFIYDIIHVSMPLLQIIPPSPSPTESKRLFFIRTFLISHRSTEIIDIVRYFDQIPQILISTLCLIDGMFVSPQNLYVEI